MIIRAAREPSCIVCHRPLGTNCRYTCGRLDCQQERDRRASRRWYWRKHHNMIVPFTLPTTGYPLMVQLYRMGATDVV